MNPNIKFIIFATTIFMVLPINNTYGYQEPSTIIEGAKNFITQEVHNQHKTVDTKSINIKILTNRTIINKYCDSEVSYSFPVYSNINQRATVVAECKDQDSWKVYIPVNIKFFASAISTKKSLPKFHILNKEDLTRQKINVLQLKDQYYTDPNEIIGLALKVPVKSNTVLTANLLGDLTYGS